MTLTETKTPRTFEQVILEAMWLTDERAREADSARAAAVLLAGQIVGAELAPIVAFTGYDPAWVQQLDERLRGAWIWQGAGLSTSAQIEWQRFGNVAIRIHAQVALGVLDRSQQPTGVWCYREHEAVAP